MKLLPTFKVDTGPLTFGGFCMNKTVFEGLPEEVQTVLASLGQVYTDENRTRIESLQDTVYDTMVSQGATLREMSQDEKVRWVEAMPDLGLNWVEANESAEVPAREMLRKFMDEAVAVGAEPLRDWAENV
jgi:C4-dicarboxylate-binding protein DctP